MKCSHGENLCEACNAELVKLRDDVARLSHIVKMQQEKIKTELADIREKIRAGRPNSMRVSPSRPQVSASSRAKRVK